MTKTTITEITFELNGTTYTHKANGYCFAQTNGKTRRIGSVEFLTKQAEYEAKYQDADVIAEDMEADEAEMLAALDNAAEDPEVTLEQFCEMSKEAYKSVAKAKKARKAKKNAAYTGHGITLTEKQVDFMHHLPDTCFWERGLDSCIWVDVLCDEIGGQFESKPMTVGAMISTICEKGLGSRGSDRRDGRKVTFFSLTELGKLVAKDLGLE